MCYQIGLQVFERIVGYKFLNEKVKFLWRRVDWEDVYWEDVLVSKMRIVKVWGFGF